MKDKDIIKIVLTGGPCAGKSTVFDTLNDYLTEKGYYVITVSETATELIRSKILPNPSDKEHTLMFQDILLHQQYTKELISEVYAKKISKNQKVVILYDRAILDNRAYLDSKEDFDSISFMTDNGESINLFFNPTCLVNEVKENSSNYFSATSVCINMIYDLNGTKSPNIMGEDIGFMTVFKPVDPMVVAPVPYIEDVEAKVQSEAAGRACTDIKSSLRAPTDYELAAMFVNSKFLGMHEGFYWSSTVHSSTNAWYLWGATGLLLREPLDRTSEMDMRCIAR